MCGGGGARGAGWRPACLPTLTSCLPACLPVCLLASFPIRLLACLQDKAPMPPRTFLMRMLTNLKQVCLATGQVEKGLQVIR